MDQLLAFDERLYLAIVAARGPLVGVVATVVTYANFQGLIWWLLGIAAWRTRGGRRGLWVSLTIFVGLVFAWATAETLKHVFQRPRPFLGIEHALPPIIPEPSSYSFPSGDTALAFGAAVAFGQVLPRFRPFALLLATAVGLSRVFVGVHYPLDVVGGAVVGTIWGLLAPLLVAWVLRLYPWRAFVVPHTHWDREWYERFLGFRARLVPVVSDLLDLLERDPAFRSFTFDGQTIPIEDHLAVRPDDRPRIEKLVRADRLLIGPWYVLADLLLVSGESLVRNLQEGLRVAGSFGRASRVAYVADPFGHPAQMPQVLRGFGYDSYVFARGVGDEGEELGSEFHWEAPSGDRVLASHQVAHYDNALQLVAADDGTPVKDVVRRVRRILPRIMDRIAPYAAGDALLFMVGTDHAPAFKDLPAAVAAIHTVAPRTRATIATLEEFIAAVPAPRGVFRGEMVSGRYRPILRGVNSTRMWLKQENAACERLLLERCEPLDAFDGGGASAELRSLWRTLLENHPHDSICGCSIDAVHDLDMKPRFARVRSEGERLVGELSSRLAGEGAAPVVWSAVPWVRDAVVTIGGRPTVVRCAPLGVTPAVRAETDGVSAPEAGVIVNGRLRVEVDEDGTFTIIDRATNTRSARQNVLIDEGDRGDEYTYSYAGPTVGSKGLRGQRATRVEGDRASVSVDLILRLPAALRDDRTARRPDLVDNRVRFLISLDAGASRVDVTATVTNAARDHRLKVVFESGVRVATHTAGAGFAWLERANRVPRTRGWIEPPTPERCFHDLVALGNGRSGVVVGADGLREYSVLPDGSAVAFTLLRAMGWLSRDDIPERRGDAGPRIETPSAQTLGDLVLRYCVVPLTDDVRLPDAARTIREFLSPAWLATGAGEQRSFCALLGDAAVALSSVRARTDDRVIVRLVNPTKAVARTTLRFARPVTEARTVDLREGDTGLGNTGLDVVRTAAPLELHDGSATATLEGFEIGTWEIEFA